MDTQRTIWLFRDACQGIPPGEALGDVFTAVFAQAGFRVMHIGVLRYEYVSEWEPVPRVDAVVLTSQRAAAALNACTNWDQLLPPNARRLPWFSMGPATRSAIEKLGLRGMNVASGSTMKLTEEIIRQGIKRIAFYAGEPHRTELTEILERAGIKVEKRIVYRSRENLKIDMTDLDSPDWAVFFSPRGVEIVSSAQGPDWRTVRIAAIGPTTATAVQRQKWNLAAVAEYPDSESLLNAIQDAERTGSRSMVELRAEL